GDRRRERRRVAVPPDAGTPCPARRRASVRRRPWRSRRTSRRLWPRGNVATRAGPRSARPPSPRPWPACHQRESWWVCRSCRICRILVYVGVSQVVGPDRRRFPARLEVDGHGHRAVGEVDGIPGFARFTAPADPYTVEGDVQCSRLERGLGGSHRGEDASPVRVLAVYSGLEQVASGDRPSHGERVVLRGGVDHLDGDVVFGTLRVAEQLLGEVVTGVGQQSGELV